MQSLGPAGVGEAFFHKWGFSLGWQGIIPSKAEKMARKACQMITQKLMNLHDVFEKVDVIGPNRHPVFEWLHHASDATDDVIPWNFTKFLITRGGKLARRFAPNAAPESLESQIRELLSEESLHDRTG